MITIRLTHGDKVVETLTHKVHKLKSGVIFGIGALDEATVKLYNLKEKEYKRKTIKGPLEIGSFMAIIAENPDGKIGIHPHIVVTTEKFITFGGHLEEAVVGATFEAVIIENKENLKRFYDPKIGLNLLQQ